VTIPIAGTVAHFDPVSALCYRDGLLRINGNRRRCSHSGRDCRCGILASQRSNRSRNCLKRGMGFQFVKAMIWGKQDADADITGLLERFSELRVLSRRWWSQSGSLRACKLLILQKAERATKAQMPSRRYKNGTKTCCVCFGCDRTLQF
jgi:hypothetical protein